MLLFLHGALYTKEEFEPLIAQLGVQFSVETIDFTGHGTESIPDDPFSMKLFATDVLHWMENQGVDNVDIFGFSMGGYVGLYLARFFPEKIGRVMTLGTKLQWNPETSSREVKMLDPVKIEEKVPRFAETLRRRHGEDSWKTVLAKTAEMMINLGEQPELPYEEFQHIEHPIRLSLGDRDHMVSIEETLEAFRCLPNAELAILPNVGHPLEKVPVDQLSREISLFFRSA